MDSSAVIENLLLCLPTVRRQHAPSSRMHAFLKRIARQEIVRLFAEPEETIRSFAPFGELVFPYHKMGAVDSLNLFDLDELIIFSFYWANRRTYRRVADIGANIGLHSILLGKCGFEVRAYEPDPLHFKLLTRNLRLNRSDNVRTFNAAVSSRSGAMEFIRVLGNTTGSHLAGSKANPYGDLETFPVDVEAIAPVIGWADLIKLDAEGHEKEILLATGRDDWSSTDALVEVGSESNAAAIYEHFAKLKIALFAQKKAWRRVRNVRDMPTSYREGTLFITAKSEMPWGEAKAQAVLPALGPEAAA